MAKFYTRYLSTPATPSPVNNTVFYGYRGNNYTVNGQFYTSSTNVKQTDNFQTACACNPCQNILASLAVDSVFEPGLLANSFDLLGSKLPNDYQVGKFQSYATNCTSRGEWTFKNMYTGSEAVFCVQTSNATSCLEGCVMGSTAPGTTPQMCSTSGSCVTCYYPCFPNYRVVEKPSGTYNCFQPWTFMSVSAGNGNCDMYAYCCCAPEQTFGNTCCPFYPATSGCNCCINCRMWCAGWCCSFIPGVFCQYNWCQPTSYTPLVEGFERVPQGCTNMYNSNCYGQSDGLVFGQNRMFLCCSGAYWCYYSHHVYGSQPYPSGTNMSTNEQGVRVFLSRSSGHTFYLHHDSNVGGIQGVDTSTAAVSRLTLKNFNHGTNATTVLTTFKKGVSGLVIPSQPDQDTTTAYRFYMISFNGADTASQTISIYRPSLDLSTGSATVGSAYTLTMTAGEQAAIYANLGHNNTHTSQYDFANFRRTTVNRIWYSTDTNNVKRLHLGIYNTNATGLVTTANGFNDANSRGKMFKIYSWSLDDATTSATYLGSVDLASYAPKYFFPLDNDWRILYSGTSFTNDIILSLNATTGLYQYQNTMPYIAPRLFKDREGRWAVQMVDNSVTPVATVYSNYIDILTSDVGQTLVVTANTTSFTYTGTTINSNVTVNVYDYLGNRIAKQVSLSIVGATATPGVTFSGGTYSTTINTSNSADTVVPVQIISSTSAKIIGTVTENL